MSNAAYTEYQHSFPGPMSDDGSNLRCLRNAIIVVCAGVTNGVVRPVRVNEKSKT